MSKKKKTRPGKQDLKRVQFDLPGPAIAELDDLVDAMGASSRAEVVRFALGLLKLGTKAKILVAENNGAPKELLLPATMQTRRDNANAGKQPTKKKIGAQPKGQPAGPKI